MGFVRRSRLVESDIFDELPKAIARRFAREIVAEHRGGRSASPLALLDPPLNQSQGEASRKLRDQARTLAAELGMAQELLARKRDVEECVRHFVTTGELSPFYSGWREGVVADPFRMILEATE